MIDDLSYQCHQQTEGSTDTSLKVLRWPVCGKAGVLGKGELDTGPSFTGARTCLAQDHG